jgi:hypothetical protein
MTENVYGQSKHISIPQYKNGDTTLWFKWQNERDDKLKLPHLISATDNFHFRFWTNGQAVDIWTNDNKIFFGLLTNYTDSYEPYDEEKQKSKPSTTFSSQVQLDTALARQSYNLINAIRSIPSEDSITGWELGFDGISYLFETSTPTYYSFKSYWTPTAQDSNLIEAKRIQQFVDDIYVLLNLRAEYDKFFATLKPGSYTSDHFIIIRKLTEKQIDNWKKYKPQRDYLASVEDTLNNYLSDTLTKIFQKYGELECYDQFYLKFSRNNKLKKITTNSDFLDFSDRINYYRCRKKIRIAFRHVRVDFVDSKIGYWKELNYSYKKIKITST